MPRLTLFALLIGIVAFGAYAAADPQAGTTPHEVLDAGAAPTTLAPATASQETGACTPTASTQLTETTHAELGKVGAPTEASCPIVGQIRYLQSSTCCCPEKRWMEIQQTCTSYAHPPRQVWVTTGLFCFGQSCGGSCPV